MKNKKELPDDEPHRGEDLINLKAPEHGQDSEVGVHLQRRSCGIVLARQSDDEPHLLIVRHNTGHWGIPKGGQEPGESDLETARRELREETGITNFNLIDSAPICERYSFVKDGKAYEKTVAYFVAEATEGEVTLQTKELNRFDWVTFSEAGNRIGHGSTCAVLTAAREVFELRRQKKG